MKAFILSAVLLTSCIYSNTFGAGASQFTIDFVNVGHAGKVADRTGYGAVGYDYRMGKYKVTIDQFAKARTADSRIGDVYTGAYQFDDSDALLAVDRDAAVLACGKVYVLPSEDAWYKAAYYKPGVSGCSLYARKTLAVFVTATQVDERGLNRKQRDALRNMEAS